MYVLVTLLEGPKFGEVDADHEPFIDSLAAEHLVLFGGDIVDAEQGVRAAYVLRCDDPAAEAIVATDPLATSDVMRPRLAEWQLVTWGRSTSTSRSAESWPTSGKGRTGVGHWWPAQAERYRIR